MNKQTRLCASLFYIISLKISIIWRWNLKWLISHILGSSRHRARSVLSNLVYCSAVVKTCPAIYFFHRTSWPNFIGHVFGVDHFRRWCHRELQASQTKDRQKVHQSQDLPAGWKIILPRWLRFFNEVSMSVVLILEGYYYLKTLKNKSNGSAVNISLLFIFLLMCRIWYQNIINRVLLLL